MLMLPNEESLWLADNALYDCAAWAYYWWNGWTRPAVQ
jgi:hypothetical protein